MKSLKEMNRLEKIEYFKKNIQIRNKKLLLGFDNVKNRFQIEKNIVLLFKEVYELDFLNNEDMCYLAAFNCLSTYVKQLIYWLYTDNNSEFRKIYLKALYLEIESDVMSSI